MKISWNGFSKKSYQERLKLLQAQALLSPEKQVSLEQDEQISVTVADQLSENVVGTFSLPYSLVPEVLVNGPGIHSSLCDRRTVRGCCGQLCK